MMLWTAVLGLGAEQSTPNLGLYMKMYIFTSTYVRDVYREMFIIVAGRQGRGSGSGLGDRSRRPSLAFAGVVSGVKTAIC